MYNIYFIPFGTSNLQQIFSVDFNDIEEYYIEVLGQDDAVLASSNNNIVARCKNEARIHFVNSAGAVDAVNFTVKTVKSATKSDQFQRTTKHPLLKENHSIGRFNIESNDTVVASTTFYGENDMQWLDELFSTPVAWIEKELEQSQGKQLVSIVIVDKEIVKVKEGDAFLYETEIEFIMSNDKFIINN